MTTDLYDLKYIPLPARRLESRARQALGDDALRDATWMLVSAPGCHTSPNFAPPILGWCVTEEAARAVASIVTSGRGTPAHKRISCELVRDWPCLEAAQ